MKRILIVDDEELISWGLSRTIRNLVAFDGEIKSVDNAGDAAAEIGSCKYDLCFLDVHIADGDGLELMRKARELSPGTKVVIMTSYDLDDATRKEISKYAYRFVPKPFDRLEVREIVNSALGSGNPPPQAGGATPDQTSLSDI